MANSPPELDIRGNRQATKYSNREMACRIAWSMARAAFLLSPRPLFRWRALLLRSFGARIGSHFHIYPSATIYFPWNLAVADWSSIGERALIYNLGPISIGSRVTISHGAHLCAGTHDYSKPDFRLLKPPIRIEDNVWVCADAFIGPGVTVGNGAIVGARAVVTKDVAPWTIVAGNPARVVKLRSQS